ncbi:ABC transporter substrate-binding protein [Oceanibacterium hippocampi]|uniref:Glutathione-binding protein GsiB n=1 Tax=Oceanibacterium hippocampi TaxID=745714 RepID=A0A1Y5SE03_9PROT|nr:ABC transporter substrate-binding protein [Oceanibacterium hippocampi]SLN38550.1 Glutathione-binding protein GsiB precursor [Oceanibacterium hippocampi]
MRFKSLLIGAAIAVAVALPGQAKELRFAFQGDLKSLDPYNLNETFTLGFLGNIYEGLTRRSPDLSIEPALAESWSIEEPTRWRFNLRKGVKFQDGTELTADDVLFSADRVRADGSDLKTRLAGVVDVIKVDDHTVDFVTDAPNPILHAEWSTWYIMSKAWAEKNGATKPQAATGNEENYATRHANGTGPFMIETHEVGVRTVAVPNPNWWDKATHNLTKVTFTQIAADPTRVAALLSGEVDMAYPIPLQDQARVDANPGTRVLAGPELRTIFLGMDQFRDELLYSNIKGKNPFKDHRVREAFFRAIDIEAIKAKVMRGNSQPSAMMVAPGVQGGGDPRFTRLGYDPDKSKALLAEAGYADGFEVGMDCPNDRYVNDEQICLAVVSMLAKVGIKVNLNAQPKALYFKKILAPSLDTSFYLLGWTPGSFDSWNVLYNIHGCPDESGKGKFNLGGYCNPKVDELTAKVLSETDADKRAKMVSDAWAMTIEDISHIPLHQQALSWGVSNKVELAQRADNEFHWRHVTIK